jgi:ornithine cyclodeaminase
MRIFTASQTAAALPYPALAKTIAEVLTEARAGKARAPERLHLPLPGNGVLLVMPAVDTRIAITKLVTAHPANPAAGLPLIQGEVVAMDAKTGERLGVLDGPTLTARRTAAATLLALLRLRPIPPKETLLLFGAGVQARAHLEALCEGAGIGRALILARSEGRASALAEHARSLGLEAEVLPCPSQSATDQCEKALAEALREARVLAAATTSKTPLLSDAQAALVREDAFIAAVGAFTPDAAELPPSLYLRGRVFVDACEALRSSGDLLQAIAAGLAPSLVLPLAEALERNGRLSGARSGPLVYKSVGGALLDLAAARLAFGVDEFCDLESECFDEDEGAFGVGYDEDGRGCED